MSRRFGIAAAVVAIFAGALVNPVVAYFTCSEMLGDPVTTTVYPFASFIACLKLQPIDDFRAGEFVNLVQANAKLHSLAPFLFDVMTDIAALGPDSEGSMYELYMRFYRDYVKANDKHFVVRGTPFFQQIAVVRPLFIGIRAPEPSSNDMQVYVKETLSSDAISNLRFILSDETPGIPSYDSLAGTIGKQIERINDQPAMTWVRQQASAMGFDTASTNLNVAALQNFMFLLPDVYDHESAAETFEFTDGSSLSVSRFVVRSPIEDVKVRCDLPSNPGGPAWARHADAEQAPEEESKSQRQVAGSIEAASLEAVEHALRHVAVAPDHPQSAAARLRAMISKLDPSSANEREASASFQAQQAAQAPVAGDPSYTRTVEGFGTARIYRGSNGAIVASLNMKTFMPPTLPESLNDLKPFSDMIEELLDAAEGVTNTLVIDVASNGGGLIALQDLVLRVLDQGYNIYWQTDSNGDPVSSRPPLVGVTDKNTVFVKSYLRTDVLESSPLRAYYPYIMNTGTYGASHPMQPDWFEPVTRNGYSGAYRRPSLFQVSRDKPSPFSRVVIVSDGFCGSACCQLVERVKRYGLNGAQIEFVAFGGDSIDDKFQMGTFCGGSVMQLSCVASNVLQIWNPYISGSDLRDNLDANFADTVWFAEAGDDIPVQQSPVAFATKWVKNWDALGNSDDAHNTRLAYVVSTMDGSTREATRRCDESRFVSFAEDVRAHCPDNETDCSETCQEDRETLLNDEALLACIYEAGYDSREAVVAELEKQHDNCDDDDDDVPTWLIGLIVICGCVLVGGVACGCWRRRRSSQTATANSTANVVVQL
jgi:hypothetical protein